MHVMAATRNIGKPSNRRLIYTFFLNILLGIYEPEMAMFSPHHELGVARLAN